jgi:hypothetical protein
MVRSFILIEEVFRAQLVWRARMPLQVDYLLCKHTVAAYNFNWMTAYVSKHSRMVSNGVLRSVLCLTYLRARDLAIATLLA